MTAPARADRESPSAPARYDADYFERDLHREHWFTNNAAKRRRRWREVLRMLEPQASDRILEIGCGDGAHTVRLAALCGEAVGIDRSLAGVQRAERRSRSGGLANAAFVCCDAASLPFRASEFDKAAAIDFVEHVADDVLARVLAELRRVLRPRGLLAIYTPCATHYVERLKARNLVLRQLPGHIAVRAPQAYAALLRRAGFAIRSQWFSPSDYPLFGALDRLIAPVPVAGRWFRFRICIVATSPSR